MTTFPNSHVVTNLHSHKEKLSISFATMEKERIFSAPSTFITTRKHKKKIV
jgi:hypothetical protein